MSHNIDGPTAGNVPQEIELVNFDYDLTQEVKDRINEQYKGSRLKKVNFSGQDFVFRVITQEVWDRELKTWQDSLPADKKVDVTDFDKKLIEVAVVFPAVPNEFPMVGHELLFWNNQPAGVQPRLARQIEHHSGFLVGDLASDEDFVAEDLYEYDRPSKPSKEELDSLKKSTQLPLRLVGLLNYWWVIRAMKHSEAKLTRKMMDEDRNGEHDLKQLKRCILHGAKEFDDLPQGIVANLIAQLREVSGLGEENVFAEVVEDF